MVSALLPIDSEYLNLDNFVLRGLGKIHTVCATEAGRKHGDEEFGILYTANNNMLH